MNIYRVNFYGRESGHNGAECTITAHKAVVGTEIGIMNLVAYQAAGYSPEDVFAVTLHYTDGMYFGPVVYGRKATAEGWELEHVSAHGHNFSVNCTRND